MLNSHELAIKALARAEVAKAIRKGNRRRRVQVAAMLLCACIVTAAAVYMLLPSGQQFTAIDDIQPPLAGSPFIVGGVDPAFSLPLHYEITIPAGETEVNLPLANPDGNRHWLTFEIVLADTGESLYTSGPTPPSTIIGEAVLSRALPEGEHAAVIHINVYEPGSFIEVSTATVTITIRAIR